MGRGVRAVPAREAGMPMRVEWGDQTTPEVNWSRPGSSQRRLVPSGPISHTPRPTTTATHEPAVDQLASAPPPKGKDVTLRTSLPSIAAVQKSPPRMNPKWELSGAQVIGAGN